MVRGRKEYTEDGLATLIKLAKIHASLQEISAKIDRPVYGAVQKMRKLSAEYPDIFNEETLRMYGRQYYEIEGRNRVKAHRSKKRISVT